MTVRTIKAPAAAPLAAAVEIPVAAMMEVTMTGSDDLPEVGLVSDTFENRIIDSDLAPCMQDVMNKLTTISKGVGEIVQDFAIDELDPGQLGNMNWTVADSTLPQYLNGSTSLDYNHVTNTVTTYFDSGKFNNATNISVAEIIIHEAIHAYTVFVYFNTNELTGEPEKYLGKDWGKAYYNNDQGHQFMAENFRDKMTAALDAFAGPNDYGSQFFDDMVWGGLITDGNGNEYQFFKDEIPDADIFVRDKSKNNIQGYAPDTLGYLRIPIKSKMHHFLVGLIGRHSVTIPVDNLAGYDSRIEVLLTIDTYSHNSGNKKYLIKKVEKDKIILQAIDHDKRMVLIREGSK